MTKFEDYITYINKKKYNSYDEMYKDKKNIEALVKSVNMSGKVDGNVLWISSNYPTSKTNNKLYTTEEILRQRKAINQFKSI